MCDKRRGIWSCRFWLEDGGKKRIEKITESGCVMVEEMLRSIEIHTHAGKRRIIVRNLRDKEKKTGGGERKGNV